MASTESMVWPPAIGMPASRHTDVPPSRMRPMVCVDSTLIGMPTSASAMIGRPPIA